MHRGSALGAWCSGWFSVLCGFFWIGGEEWTMDFDENEKTGKEMGEDRYLDGWEGGRGFLFVQRISSARLGPAQLPLQF